MMKDLGKLVSVAAISASAILPTNVYAHHSRDCQSEAKRIVGNIRATEKDSPKVKILYMGGIGRIYHDRNYMECLVDAIAKETQVKYKATFNEGNGDWVYIVVKNDGPKL